ncbi:hypothetical protein SLS62_005391 [Diatrype stigma]|uniref:Uncharacterized protein n=1 Tax=Diatrype stigma TaxID=117547 RepID=A0AAN9UT31_9PEZI
MRNQQIIATPEENMVQQAPEVEREGGPTSPRQDKLAPQTNEDVGEISSSLPAGREDETAFSILQDAAKVKPEERIELAVRSTHAGRLGSYRMGGRFLREERARGTVEEQSKHAMFHIHLTESRITELETELQNIKTRLYGRPDDTPPPKPKEMHYVYRHVINRVDAQEFRITQRSFDVPIEERPALEALIPGIITQQDSGGLHRRNTGLNGSQPHTPERLRVRSRALLSHLQRITGTPGSFNLQVPKLGKRENQETAVFLRPFKLFMCYDREIRRSLPELEAAVLHKKTRAETQEEHSKEVENKTFTDEDLLEDLKLLVEFLEVDLKPIFDLRQQIKDATATEIEYPDLWHLFERNEMVISQSDESHAYRVVNYTGGREPLIDRLTRRDDEKVEPIDGFVVDCISLEFDGTHYVPTIEKFSIRKFHGKRRITSLPVYPFKLHPEANALRNKFREQGERFLDLTRDQFRHRMMTGRTIDDPPQDIDAQVVVDIAMALNLHPEWQPGSNNIEANLTVSDKRETQIPTYCHHNRVEEGCCGGDVADKDLELDRVELSKYFQDSGHLLSPRKEEELDEEELILLPHWVYGFVLRSRMWVKLRTANLSDVIFENDFGALLLPEEQKRTIQALVATHENAVSNASPGVRTVGSGIDIVKGKGSGLILLLHGEPEYYGGILFLTSNRVGNLDPAFKSRIHMSVFYSRLNMEATRKLYKIFTKRVEAEQERTKTSSFEIKKKEILQFAKRHFRQMEKEGLPTWNGRQIRNAFQAAIALAEYEGQKTAPGQPLPILGESQFQVVAESSMEFDRYMLSTLGGAEADIAFRDSWRDDGYPSARGQQHTPVLRTAYNPKLPGRQAVKTPESDDTDTDSDDEDSSSDDDKGPKAVRVAGKQASTSGPGSQSTQGTNDYEEFQAFMKWKSNQK